MRHYWYPEDQTRKTLRYGWLRAGDVGYRDEQSFLFFVDRATDMIISGGENIFSVEVEGARCPHPAVQERAIIGIPSDPSGDRVHAVAVRTAGSSATGEEIIAHCRALMPGTSCPAV